MPLHPLAAELLAMLHRVDAPRLPEQTLDVARRNFQKLLFAYREEPVPLDVTDCLIPRREHAGGPLKARFYRSGEGELPVLLWLHGGGWMLGDVAGYDSLCRRIAARAGCAVLSLDYRLAPEHRFPAAIEDARWALRWLIREGGGLGLDIRRVAVGGDSAGGNLAAVLAHLARDEGLPLCLQWLVYPALDQSGRTRSMRWFGEGHFLDAATLRWFRAHYLEAEADALDWRASPLRASCFAGLAPAFIQTAECDPLTDDGSAYTLRLAEAGVPVCYREYAGMIHGFLGMGRLFRQAGEALEDAAACLRVAFSADALLEPGEF